MFERLVQTKRFPYIFMSRVIYIHRIELSSPCAVKLSYSDFRQPHINFRLIKDILLITVTDARSLSADQILFPASLSTAA